MSVPNTFASATSSIPLANLDANFAYYDAAFSISGTAVTFAGSITLTTGTANGVAYLNGSKVLTTGSALTFDGVQLTNSQNSNSGTYIVNRNVNTSTAATAYVISDATAAFSGYTAMGSRSSGYTTSGMLEANSGGVFSVGLTNGLNIMTLDGYPVKFGVANAEKMRLDSSGNLGIGTSSPVYQTQIYGSGQTTAALTDSGNKGGSLLLNTPTVAGGDGGALLIGAGGAGAKPFAAIKGLLADGGGNTTGALAFSTRNATGDTSLTERMRLDSSGNLGIGTTSPDAKLDVTGPNLAAVFGSETAQNTYVGFKYNSTILGYVGNGSGVAGPGSATDFSIGSTGARALTFGTNDLERMRLDSAGNLGLGVTPSAWNAGSKAIQVSTFVSVSQQADGAANFGFNFYENAANAFRYSTTDEACRFSALTTGGFGWFQAPSGTAGNAITFTQAMTLSAAGGLSVGSTTDAGSGNILIPSGGKLFGAATSGSFYSYVEPYNASTGNMNLVAAYASGAMTFATGGTTERMRLDASGNLGIGTSTPAYKLDAEKSSDGIIGYFRRIGATINPALTIYANETGNTVGFGTDYAGATSPAITFSIAASEKLRLDSSGNLGLGVTPSAWAARAFQIGNASNSGWASIGYDANGKGFFATSAFNDTGSAWQYTATGLAATLYSADFGTHKWFIAPSGTAGNAITFTQAMTLDASGNLLVGTTTAVGKFTVDSGSSSNYAAFNTTNATGGYAEFSSSGTAQGDIGTAAQIVSGGASTDFGINARGARNLIFGTNNTERARIDSSGNLLVGLTSATGVAKLQVSGPIQTTGYTVATLPAGTVGMRTYVTDALAPSFGVTVAGSGAVTIPVFYNGTNWIVA